MVATRRQREAKNLACVLCVCGAHRILGARTDKLTFSPTPLGKLCQHLEKGHLFLKVPGYVPMGVCLPREQASSYRAWLPTEGIPLGGPAPLLDAICEGRPLLVCVLGQCL